MSVIGIKLIVLHSKQLDKTKAFYEALGMKFKAEKHNTGPEHYAAELENCVFELYPLPELVEASTDLLHIGIYTSHIDYLLNNPLLSASIVIKPRHTKWGYRVVLSDPDGRAVELYED